MMIQSKHNKKVQIYSMILSCEEIIKSNRAFIRMYENISEPKQKSHLTPMVYHQRVKKYYNILAMLEQSEKNIAHNQSKIKILQQIKNNLNLDIDDYYNPRKITFVSLYFKDINYLSELELEKIIKNIHDFELKKRFANQNKQDVKFIIISYLNELKFFLMYQNIMKKNNFNEAGRKRHQRCLVKNNKVKVNDSTEYQKTKRIKIKIREIEKKLINTLKYNFVGSSILQLKILKNILST